MDALNWDDPAIEENWCCECRKTVTDYLAKEGLHHGEVASWPAWHVAPYISLWAIESLQAPGNIGWWAICGDLPTDYISAATAKHPRKAMRALADAWRDVAECLASGVPHPRLSLGPSEQNPELAFMLESRASVLRRFAEDNSMWGPAYD